MPTTGISIFESIASFILVSFWKCVKVSGRKQGGALLVNNGVPVSETPNSDELLGDSGEPSCIAEVKYWGGWTDAFKEGVLFTVVVKVRVKYCSPSSPRHIDIIICVFV